MQAHQRIFRRALEAELHEERQESEARLTSWSRERLQEEGVVLFDLRAKLDGALFRDSIVRFTPAAGRDAMLPFHSFSRGDMVLISQGSPSKQMFKQLPAFCLACQHSHL